MKSLILSPRDGGGGGGGGIFLTGMVQVYCGVPLNWPIPASTSVITAPSVGASSMVKVTVSCTQEKAGRVSVNPVQVISMLVPEYGPVGGLMVAAAGLVVKLLICTLSGTLILSTTVACDSGTTMLTTVRVVACSPTLSRYQEGLRIVWSGLVQVLVGGTSRTTMVALGLYRLENIPEYHQPDTAWSAQQINVAIGITLYFVSPKSV